LAKTDSPAVLAVRRSVNVADVAEQAYIKAKHLAAERQISLSLDISTRDVFLDGDPDSLSRMFLALFENAVKYTPTGGQVKAGFAVCNDAAVFAITDSGIGIPPDALPHIFERFYRADTARTRSDGGFGLGLAIAKAIANAHHADIEAESLDGKGSLFRISFRVFSQTHLELLPK